MDLVLNAKERDLKKIFDEYNKGAMPQDFNNSYLESLLKEKNNYERIPKKVASLGKMVKQIQKDLNAVFANQGTKFELFSNTTISSDIKDGKITTNIRLFELGDGSSSIVNIPININIKHLLQMPPQEVYAIIKGLVYHSVLCKSMDKVEEGQNHDFDEVLLYRDKSEIKELEKHVNEKKNMRKAEQVLKNYFTGLFRDCFSEEFNRFDNIAELIAKDIVSTMEADDVEKMLGTFFDISSFKKLGIEKVEDFLNLDYNTLSKARIKKISSNAESMVQQPGKDIEAIDYEKQAQALLSLRTKSKYQELKNSGNDKVNLQQFCVNFINDYMSSNGLSGFGPENITFNSVDKNGKRLELGTYYDNGETHSININLNRIDSVTELIMTLTHELTHAKTSVLNKSHGIYDRKTGSGLVDGMDENISNSGLDGKSQEYKLLAEIQEYCYHLNPNEREARIGELSALSLMEKLDPEMSGEIATSKKRYELYQQKTIAIANAVSGKEVAGVKTLKQLKAEYDSLKSNMPERARYLIEKRLAYLEGLANDPSKINMAEEEKSIAAVQSLNAQEKRIENKKSQEEILKEIEESQMGM